MLQVALSDLLFLDLFPFSENDFIAAEVDVGGVTLFRVSWWR